MQVEHLRGAVEVGEQQRPGGDADGVVASSSATAMPVNPNPVGKSMVYWWKKPSRSDMPVNPAMAPLINSTCIVMRLMFTPLASRR